MRPDLPELFGDRHRREMDLRPHRDQEVSDLPPVELNYADPLSKDILGGCGMRSCNTSLRF